MNLRTLTLHKPAVLTAFTLFALGLLTLNFTWAEPIEPAKTAPANPVQTTKPETTKKEVKALPASLSPAPKSYAPVEPLALLKNPSGYLHQGVTFEADFNGFSGLGLDYKKVMRPGKDYVGLLIRRPDVNHHIIPLSELKLFYPRVKSEQVMEVETGDKVRIKGVVFATPLDEPWVDVLELSVVQKAPKKPTP